MVLQAEDAKTPSLWNEALSAKYMTVNGVVAIVTGLAVSVGPRLLATTHTVTAASFIEKAQVQQNLSMELMASNEHGRLMGFVIGSLAQPWHGAVCFALIALCVLFNDPFFGFCRVAMGIGAPEGKKTISWEHAYGPLLRQLGVRTADPELAQEQTPLVQAQ
eukprot:gnl/MRDRNA2_/MRDRNA2_86043_c0_seq1.p1 gnl/MRDRNA2_/MRDRNA2_86043_c0~~gnl/MRDRNA2_/MRDRNA2_86043_c0_seq1.p1  ORF type:complete len:187 (-),score=45.31 gnl/MRDRNA2_/MRDRNA2_86043_c0_seq1:82-567(-)